MPNQTDPNQKQPLPGLSAICLGCWGFAGGLDWGDQDDKDSINTIHAALDNGITALDTAPGYGSGHSESIVGQATKKNRDAFFIATKISNKSQSVDDIVASCEQSLELLQTDHIDLYQVHWPLRQMPFEGVTEALQKLRKAGKIRYAGVCNYGPGDLGDHLATGLEIVTNQLPYSLLSRSIEFEIIPKCAEQNIGVLAYSPLMQGLLTGKYDCPDDVPEGRRRTRLFSSSQEHARHGEEGCESLLFQVIGQIRQLASDNNITMEQLVLRWVLKHKQVYSVIAGARNEEQVRQNTRALEAQLDDALYVQLNQITRPIKEYLGSNPDLWSTESRYR